MIILFLFVVGCFVKFSSQSADTLIFAHVIFRHGQRNIIEPFGPEDPFTDVNKYWAEGYGELTNEGRRQEHELGVYLAKRYKNLIGEKGYHRDKIYVRSTDVDRTLMSASHVLAGMLPPVGKQIWNKDLGQMWHAIPIHTVPEIDDYVLSTKRSCPRYKQARSEMSVSSEVKAIEAKHAEFFKNLTDLSGREIDDIDDVNTLYQTLKLQRTKGLITLPKWANDLIKNGSLMEKIANYKHSFYGSTIEMAKIRPGYLLNEILDRFMKKANGTLKPDRTLWLYSAHDITIANILGGLGVFHEPHIPPFSSSVFVELHKIENNHHIEVYYKKKHGNDKKPLKPLKLRCGARCPLNEFYKAYKEILPTQDYDTECKI